MTVETVNLLHRSRLYNHWNHVDHLLLLMAQSLPFWHGLQRPLNDPSQCYQWSFYELLVLNQFSLQRTLHYMQIRWLLTVPADVKEYLLNHSTTFHFLFLVRNHRCNQLRNHTVQILGQVVLCVYYTVNCQVACSITILNLYVPNLSVQCTPKFPHMSSNEESTSKWRSSL